MHPTLRRTSIGALALLAAAGLSLTVTSTATAAPVRAKANPEAMTSSTGAVPAATASALAGSTQSKGYAGTGKVPKPFGRAPAGAPLGGTDSIFGTDDRIQITGTTAYPARATVMITRNGNAHCSGWMIGPNTVATAGHCVHSGGSAGSWYSGLVAWPGRNGASAPYGGCASKLSYSVSGWTVNGDEQFDYGVIKLNCTIGNTVGWYGYFWQSASLSGLPTLVSGYPGEKAFGTQWRGDWTSRTVATVTAEQVFYPNDTTGGMSGSPVYYDRPGCGTCTMAIHAYGFPHGGFPHNVYNHGTRITQAKFNNLQAWNAAP